MHADHIAVNAFVDVGSGAPGALPEMRFAMLPAGDVEILDTWHVNGLKGTGSHDILLEDHFVPGAWIGSVRSAPPVVRQPLDAVPLIARLGLELSAVAVGIAQGALDDLVEVARSKLPLGGLRGRLAEDPLFQHTVGSLVTELRMARILLHHLAVEDHTRAVAGVEPDPATMTGRRALLARVVAISASVVDGCYVASGTTGLYESNPLQRRLRDVRAVSQHGVVAVNPFAPTGASVLGAPVPPGMF
jgi:indole-3-acetate monooxygenase